MLNWAACSQRSTRPCSEWRCTRCVSRCWPPALSRGSRASIRGCSIAASPVATSTPDCSPNCPRRSIRAASAASFIRSPTLGPCSVGPFPSRAARSSSATASSSPMSKYPSRIVCLTEETTETLYLLGQGDRVVGVSGYTVRPPEARQKPKVSAFINAKFDKIEALRPDLVLAFSDLQADLSAELVRRGIPVVVFNQRTVAEILQMIRMLGGLIGCQAEAERLADRLTADLDRIRESASCFPARFRVFFEEWDEPLISGIRWVEEMVEIAGGSPIFPELAAAGLAKDRIVDPAEVARRDPQVIFASWCGKKMKKSTIQTRPGWDAVSAVRRDRIYEIKSTYILQPGPASLTDGVQQLHALLSRETGVPQQRE